MEDVEQLGDEGGEDSSENEEGMKRGVWSGSDEGVVLQCSDQATLLWKVIGQNKIQR